MKKFVLCTVLLAISYGVSAQRNEEVVENPNQSIQENGMVLKRKVAIGRFSNETQYAKGIFYDKENDPMGKQALDILSAKLAASGKFQTLNTLKPLFSHEYLFHYIIKHHSFTPFCRMQR